MSRRPQIVLERARIVADPERLISKAGNEYMRLRFAVNPTHKAHGQTVEDDPMYFDAVIVDDGMMGECMKMLGKGDLVTVSGGLKAEAYADRQGNPKTRLSIEWPHIGLLVDRPPRKQEQPAGGSEPAQQDTYPSPQF